MLQQYTHFLLGYCVLFLITVAFVVVSYPIFPAVSYIMLAYVAVATVLFSITIRTDKIKLTWQDVVVFTLKTPIWFAKFVVEGLKK